MKLPDKFEILIPIAVEMGEREGVVTYANIQRYLHVSFQLSQEIVDFLLEHKAIYKDKKDGNAIWRMNQLESFMLLDRIIHEREWQKHTGTKKLTREQAERILSQTSKDHSFLNRIKHLFKQ